MALELSLFSLLALGSSAGAQSVPSVLPGTWTSMGCYTDVSISRTLKGASTVSTNMTIESCIAYCDSLAYNYAGAEFSKVLTVTPFSLHLLTEAVSLFAFRNAVPGAEAAMTDCSWGCTGNSSEVCGASGRMNLFYNGKPGPQIIPSVTLSDSSGNSKVWTYQGCYTDTVGQRTLVNPVNVPSGVTAETCTAACQSLGSGYTLAGLENGQECWCDNTINPPQQHVSDNDCRQICVANHNEYCGNANRIQVYKFSNGTSTDPEAPQTCVSQNVDKFTLQAVYKNSNDGGTVDLKMVVTELVPNIVWSILSACSTCCTEWPYFGLQNSVIFPRAPSNPNLQSASIGPGDGESLSFVSSNPAFPGFQAYCTVNNTLPGATDASPQLLSFGGKSDAFSLCTNTSANANGRLDVIYSPVTGHPNYELINCKPVSIQVIPVA